MIRCAPVLLAVLALSCSSEKSPPVASKSEFAKSPPTSVSTTKAPETSSGSDDAKEPPAKERTATKSTDASSELEEAKGSPAVARIDPEAPPKPAPSSAKLDPSTDQDSAWASHTGSLPFVIGYEKGRALAESSQKPAMYFVTAQWCRYCKQMAEDNFDSAEIKKLLEGFVCVLVDQDTESRAARRLGSAGIPHVVFTTSDGTPVDTVTGAKSKEDFTRILEQVQARVKKT